jgi:hypothetical protein
MGPALTLFLLPMYGLLILVLMSFVQQLGGTGFFLVGSILLFTGPILALRPCWELVGPLTAEQVKGPLARYRMRAGLVTGLGLLCVFIGLLTTKLFGYALVGTGEGSLMGIGDVLLLVVWFLAMLHTYTIVSADALLEVMTRADALRERADASKQFADDTATLARLEAAVGTPVGPPA